LAFLQKSAFFAKIGVFRENRRFAKNTLKNGVLRKLAFFAKNTLKMAFCKLAFFAKIGIFAKKTAFF
jgi:hypothetical protein